MVLAQECVLPSGNVYEPRSKTCFKVDHTTLTAVPVKDKVPSLSQQIVDNRNALDQAVTEYVVGFYPEGSSAVYAAKPSGFKIYIVRNKYSLSNFLCLLVYLGLEDGKVSGQFLRT